eukprot:COSAG01_NODE_8759_length_2669_cov_46.491051_2_plen_155_part_00
MPRTSRTSDYRYSAEGPFLSSDRFVQMRHVVRRGRSSGDISQSLLLTRVAINRWRPCRWAHCYFSFLELFSEAELVGQLAQLKQCAAALLATGTSKAALATNRGGARFCMTLRRPRGHLFFFLSFFCRPTTPSGIPACLDTVRVRGVGAVGDFS